MPNESPSAANVLNLLGPFLSLNGTAVGQTTLTQNLNVSIGINNNSGAAQRAQAISDKTIASPSANGTNPTITLQNGQTLALGPGDNLAGGLPPQAIQSNPGQPGTITPVQPVGGYGYVLGPDYQTGIRASNATSGPLTNTYKLLTNAYNFASNDLGSAKAYFADGFNSSQTAPAVPPPGYTLPTYNGLPNATNSVYDIAYGKNKTQPGQDIYGNSRPDQVSSQIQTFDPTALNGLATNPSFPSGHTTYAFTDSILLAMLTPSLYQSQIARGADYANDRIVLGVHYALDIIGSRALAAYELAQEFTNPLYINNPTTNAVTINLPALFTAAQAELPAYLSAQCGAAVATCATSAANLNNDPYAPSAATQATFDQRLTYGLPTLSYAQAPREAAPAGGPDASILLAPLFGGSTAAALAIEPNGGTLGSLQTSTINQILLNTEGQAISAFYGTSLSYWTRIDLYSAAGYFGGTTGTLTLASADRVRTNVTVGSGSTVYGNGAAITGNVSVASGGTFGAGSATTAATTAITGNLTLQSGSTLAVVGANGQFSLARVSGTAAINGANVSAAVSGTFLPFTRIPILTAAGGVTGTFANTTSTTPGIVAFTITDANNAYLVLDRTNVNFAAFGATLNQQRVGAAIGGAAPTITSAAAGQIVNTLFADALQSPALGQAFLDSLSGEGYTATQNAAFQSSAIFVSSIEDEQNAWRLPQTAGPAGITLTSGLPGGALGYADASQLPFPPVKGPAPVPVAPPRLWRAWGGGFGASSTIDGDGSIGTARQTDDLYGGALGVDYQLAPNLLIGAAGSGTNADFAVSNRATSGTVTGGQGAVYGTFVGPTGFYAQSTLAFSGFDNTVQRTAGFGALAENERASFGSFEVRVRGEFGERLAYGFSGVTPFVAVEYANLHSDGFTEQNAATGVPGVLSLTSTGRTTESLPVFAGLRFDTTYLMGGNRVLRPFIQAAYIHEFDPTRNLVNTFVSLPGASFLVEGARPAEDAAQIKAGFDLSVGAGVAVFANFDGEFSGVENVYGGKGGIKVAF